MSGLPARFLLTGALALLLAACGLERDPVRSGLLRAESLRASTLDCVDCVIPTPLSELAEASVRDSGADRPVHYVALLDDGEASLVLRLHLIRSARRTVELQSFILGDDQSGRLVLAELVAAARRGVRVRVLLDQLFSLDDAGLVAALASAHVNLELRVFNPTFGELGTQPVEFAAGILCCFVRFNQRMHEKLLLVDGRYGVTGGRNVDDRYFDLSDTFVYRDRDVLLVGPETAAMAEGFEADWHHESAVPAAGLRDVAVALERPAGTPLDRRLAELGARAGAIAQRAGDAGWVRGEFVERAFRVGRVSYFADLPDKLFSKAPVRNRAASDELAELLAGAQERVTLETPYLVLSKRAQEVLGDLRTRHPEIQMRVVTNSLAATDAFYVYAISYKYKRRYLARFKLDLHEFKPNPTALGEGTVEARGKPRIRIREPVPLTRPGVRRGLHAKALVLDGRIAVIGSHNFDPRSERLNTENGLVVWDETFARALEASVERDLAPEQAWLVARQPVRDPVNRIGVSLTKVSEHLPVFDIWPFRYATSYERLPDCTPDPEQPPALDPCYRDVGDFPEVGVSLKQLYTRLVAAFGAGLEPIL